MENTNEGAGIGMESKDWPRTRTPDAFKATSAN